MARWWRNSSVWRRRALDGARRAAALPMVREIFPDLSWRSRVVWRRESLAGVLGALLVIPQAVTFAWLAGLPPEYGVNTAIWVTLFACLWGGSTVVGGPNTAVAILLGVTVSAHAGRGSPLYLELTLLLSAMVGGIQLLIWLVRGGRYFQYFSPSAILGVTTGVGGIIALSSLAGLTGAVGLEGRPPHETLYLLGVALLDGLHNPFSLGVGLLTAAVGWGVGGRWGARWSLLAAMGAGWAASGLLHGVYPQPLSEMAMVGRLPLSWLPLSAPPVTWDHLTIAREMLPGAMSIALVGLAQSMVIAKGINLSGREQVDLHRETFAQGMANLLGSFFSSFAGSGSFNRTAAGHQLGAVTAWPGVVSSVATLLVIQAGGDLFSTLPMPVMAGVLLLVGVNMIKPAEIRRLGRGEFVAFALVLAAVLLLGLGTGIALAAAASVIPFLLNAASLQGKWVRMQGGVSLELYGNLFFASMDALVQLLRQSESEPLIVNLRHVSHLDAGAAELLSRESKARRARGVKMVIYVHTSAQQTVLDRVDPRSEHWHLVSSLPEARLALLEAL
ncbi:MAG: SulP family inorganic anion transporter [Magnetococcales bacterium]|nr:SulP family inorganic anion transporter [Magnetococcales bacterium]